MKDTLQDIRTSYCGVFCLYLLYNLFNSKTDSGIVEERSVTGKTMQRLINELFYPSKDNGAQKNSQLLQEFVDEYDIAGTFV